MNSTISSETLHATCVAIDGRGVLLTGPSGAGKSDLALRLIDRGAALVSDDYTLVTRHDGALLASAPARIANTIEVRGVGLLPMAAVADVPVALVAALEGVAQRLPDPEHRIIAGIPIPVLAVAAFEASAAIKLELALAHLGQR